MRDGSPCLPPRPHPHPLQVVCWKCSDNKVALEYDGNRLNKVCKSCYPILSAQRGGRAEGGRRRQTPEVSATHSTSEGGARICQHTAFLCVSNATVCPQSGGCVISSFLFYGDDPTTRQQLWCVLPRTEAPALQLYAAQQVRRVEGR